MRLKDKVATGEYATPAGYLVNEKEAEAFDRAFPYMEKKKLPGQIFLIQQTSLNLYFFLLGYVSVRNEIQKEGQ